MFLKCFSRGGGNPIKETKFKQLLRISLSLNWITFEPKSVIIFRYAARPCKSLSAVVILNQCKYPGNNIIEDKPEMSPILWWNIKLP